MATDMKMAHPSLGQLIRRLRQHNGWTLKDLSKRSGIPVSTLSKVEHDQMSLTYDKLFLLSKGLGMRMSELFADTEVDRPSITARRSIGRFDRAMHISTPN
jgi:transcriptional regulator with XRE-family HTH domain